MILLTGATGINGFEVVKLLSRMGVACGFRHRPGPNMQQWRVKNISTRYYKAGVRRFAFLFPEGALIPPMMNQPAPGEGFATRAFDIGGEALHWLSGAAGK